MNKYIIREWIVGSVYLDCTLGTISVYIPLYKMHKPNVFRNRHCVFEALCVTDSNDWKYFFIYSDSRYSRVKEIALKC